MRKLIIVALASIVVLTAGVALAVFLATRPLPSGAAAPNGPGPEPSLAVTPADPGSGQPVTGTPPSASPDASASAVPAPPVRPVVPPALRGAPVVPLPADPADRADRLDQVRHERLATMLEQRAARMQRGRVPIPGR